MRQLKFIIAFACLCHINSYNVRGQNPNWVMPAGNYQPDYDLFNPLPQNPAWPSGYVLGDINYDWIFKYTGSPSLYTQASYTGPDGEIKCFVVDDKVYDKNGWLVNSLRILGPPYDNILSGVKGFDEMIVLPMGNSCTKFLIIYPSSTNNNYLGPNASPDVVYGIYDTDLQNQLNPFASGAMVGQEQGEEGTGPTLFSLRQDWIANHSQPGEVVFVDVEGYQIAATKLIENCYRLVYVFDGAWLLRYKLDENGLYYDNYKFLVNSQPVKVGGQLRTEMELIPLSNGNYRLAIPTASNVTPASAIRVLDVNGSAHTVISASVQTIDLSTPGTSSSRPIGLEFDKTGRYLYFTHTATTAWPRPIDFWDVQTASLATPAVNFSSFNNFRNSFIERYDEDLYLASANHIGVIENATSFNISNWTSTHQTIGSVPYGNTGPSGGPLRYLLPDQVDDDTYGDFENFSCECCERWLSDAVSRYTATSSATWSPGSNPFGAGVGDVVIIKEELRIREGVLVTINDMEFRFMPGAEVVIEQANNGSTGGELRMNRTTFTANFDCAAKSDDFCEDCDEQQWKGVRVMGIGSEPQELFGPTAQGRLVMRDNSMIEHAAIGVRLGNVVTSSGGGIVDALNSTFKDNRIGIRFDTYVRTLPSIGEVDNVSRISVNSFVISNDYLSSALNPISFISVINSSGIITRGNLFNYARSGGINLIRGIDASNSKIRVSYHCNSASIGDCPPANTTRTEFHSLFGGVIVNNSLVATRKVQIEYAKFDQNATGASLRGTINAEVLDNDFKLRSSVSSSGLVLHTSTGYAVENNNFYTLDDIPPMNSRGITITSSGAVYNEIYRNQFNKLMTGIQTQGVNASQSSGSNYPGLQMHCNTFNTPILYDDILVRTGNISNMQGYCNDVNGPRAGNLFSHSHLTFSQWHMDFRIDQNAAPNLEVKYNHHAPSNPRLEPLAYTFFTGGVQVDPVTCMSQFNGQSCPVKKSGSPIRRIPPSGPKSGEVVDADALSIGDFQSLAVAHDGAVALLQNAIDGGNTELILQMINDGSSAEDILELVNGVEGPLSNTLQSALAYAEIEIPASTLLLSDAIASDFEASADTEDAEAAWNGAKRERTLFWRSVVDFYQTDTLGTFSAEELYTFISDHEPEGIERFASSLAYQLDLPNPTWVGSADVIDVSVDLPVSASEGDSLPQNLNHLFEGDFFDSYSNSVMLSQFYIDHDQYFDIYALPHTFADADLADDPKSAGEIDKNKEQQAVSAYPNPFNDQIVFAFRNDFKTTAQVQITFHDVTGRVVQQVQVPLDVKSFTLDGSRLPQGMLFYSIDVDGAHLQTGKLMHLK